MHKHFCGMLICWCSIFWTFFPNSTVVKKKACYIIYFIKSTHLYNWKTFFPNSKTTGKVIDPDDFNLISNFEARWIKNCLSEGHLMSASFFLSLCFVYLCTCVCRCVCIWKATASHRWGLHLFQGALCLSSWDRACHWSETHSFV